MKSLKIKPGDYVKVLKNGDFHNIVQIKKIYGSCIETSHGHEFGELEIHKVS